MMSKISLIITLLGSNCNRLQTFYTIIIAYVKHQCTIQFFCIAEINSNNTLHINMPEITLKITLHGSNYNRLLRHFIL